MNSLVSSSNFSSGKTALTKPNSFASFAEMVSPVKSSSMVFLKFMDQGKITAAIGGNTPTLISGCPNLDLSDARTISQNDASSHPPPSAAPLTRAMVGALILVKLKKILWKT